jgi:MFS family permease
VTFGAFCFGLVVGWFTYFVNRHRQDAVSLADVSTIIGAIGGAAVLGLFPAKTALFGWYGIGLALGFFGYFIVLLILVRRLRARGWTFEWFLDGRKPKLDGNQLDSHDRPMIVRPTGSGAIRE